MEWEGWVNTATNRERKRRGGSGEEQERSGERRKSGELEEEWREEEGRREDSGAEKGK